MPVARVRTFAWWHCASLGPTVGGCTNVAAFSVTGGEGWGHGGRRGGVHICIASVDFGCSAAVGVLLGRRESKRVGRGVLQDRVPVLIVKWVICTDVETSQIGRDVRDIAYMTRTSVHHCMQRLLEHTIRVPLLHRVLLMARFDNTPCIASCCGHLHMHRSRCSART